MPAARQKALSTRRSTRRPGAAPPEATDGVTATARHAARGRGAAPNLRRPRRGQRRRLHHPRALDRLADRPQRRRQDDVLQHPHRASTSRPAAPLQDPHGEPVDRACRRTGSRQLGMARTFQNIRLFGNMTAQRERDGRHAPAPQGRALADASCGTPRPAARGARGPRARRATLLQFVGLGRRDYTASRNLPYGDQRRLEVARALALRAEAAAARRADRRHEPAGEPTDFIDVRAASCATSAG